MAHYGVLACSSLATLADGHGRPNAAEHRDVRERRTSRSRAHPNRAWWDHEVDEYPGAGAPTDQQKASELKIIRTKTTENETFLSQSADKQ